MGAFLESLPFRVEEGEGLLKGLFRIQIEQYFWGFQYYVLKSHKPFKIEYTILFTYYIFKMEQLLSIINTVLENRGKAIVESINENSSLKNDCGLDSLDLAELTVRIEAEYDVDIFEDGVVTTVGEILSKLG